MRKWLMLSAVMESGMLSSEMLMRRLTKLQRRSPYSGMLSLPSIFVVLLESITGAATDLPLSLKPTESMLITTSPLDTDSPMPLMSS